MEDSYASFFLEGPIKNASFRFSLINEIMFSSENDSFLLFKFKIFLNVLFPFDLLLKEINDG